MAKPGSGTRLEKLLDLIECGSCQENRFAAGDQIISILASHPEQVPDVLQAVSTRLASPHWDARVAAARCLGAAARRFPGWTPQAMARSIGVQDAAYVELLQESWASDEDDAPLLPGFDVAELLQRAPPLVASSGEEFAASAAAGGLAAQRSALRQKLGLGGALGNLVDDRELVKDEDLSAEAGAEEEAPDAEMARVPSARLRLAASRRQKRHGGAQQGGDAKRRTLSADDEAPSAGAESISLSALRSELAAAAEVFGPVAGGEEGWAAVQAGEWALQRVWTATVPGLLSPRWETRHGAAAALRDVLREAAGAAGVVAPVAPGGWLVAGGAGRPPLAPGASPADVRAALSGGDRALARCAAALLAALALDRFSDFVGDAAVGPVRETAAQALGALCPALPPPRLAAALRALRALARCDVWQARHGALLGVRYAVGALLGAGAGGGRATQGRTVALSTGPGSPRGLCELLLQTFLEALADADDDVRSAAADALALLAPHLEPTEAAAAWDRVLVLLPGLDALSPAAGPFLSLARALATGPGGGARGAAVLPQVRLFWGHALQSVRAAALDCALAIFVARGGSSEGGERTATTTDESCAAVEEISACLLALAPRLALEPRASEDRLVARVETLWRRLVDAGNWSLRSGTEEVQLDDDQASPPAWVSDAIAALWKAGLAGPGGRPGAGAEALPPSDFEELVPGRLACGRAFGYLAESLEKRHASGASLRAAQASLRDAFAHHSSAHRPARVLVAAAALLAWSERGASAAAAEVAAAAAATLGEAPAPPLGVSAAVVAAAIAASRGRAPLPAKLNPYIQPLMAALRREPCEPLQRLAARGVAHLVVELGGKGPGDKILKNLVGFACTEPAGEPLTLEQILDSGELAMSGRRAPAAAPAAGKGKDGAAAAAAAAASAAATEVTRRGGEAALVALCQVAGDTLFDGAAPGLLEVHVVAPLRAALAAKDAEPESLRPVGQGAVAAARVVETLAPCLTDGALARLLSSSASDALPPLRLLLGALSFPALEAQLAAARAIAALARRAPARVLGAALQDGLAGLNSLDAAARRGGLVLIACVLQALGPAVIPYLPLVARPLLGRMSDGQADLRRLAAACFAAVVAVLPLSTPTVEAEKKEAVVVAVGEDADTIMDDSTDLRRPESADNADGGEASDDTPSSTEPSASVAPAATSRDTQTHSSLGLSPEQEALLTREQGFLDRLMGGAGAALESDDETQSLNPDEAARRAPGGATLALAPRPYQRQGMAWLDFLRCAGLHGILADDMGLGKTLQATAAVAAAHRDEAAASSREARAARPSLVLCPSTLVAHWAYEIGKNLAPESALRVLPYAGSPAEKAAIAARLQAADGAFDVAVASYESLRADSAAFTAIDWLYVVADEGHVLGGGSARLAAAARALRCQHRLLLTGTPIQNGVRELWALFDWVMPGFLGSSRSFNARYGRALSVASRAARLRGGAALASSETGVLALEALHRAVAPFVLRRTKGQVLQDLPPKILQDIRCTPTPLQRYLLARIQDAVGGDAQVVEKVEVEGQEKSSVATRTEDQGAGALAAADARQQDEEAEEEGGKVSSRTETPPVPDPTLPPSSSSACDELVERSAPSAVASLVAMRKLCTHPALLLEGGAIQMDEAARAAVRGALPREGAGVAATREAELAALRADLAQAPKLAALAELLREAGLGRKGGAEGRDVEVVCGDAEDGVAAKTGSRRASTPDNGSPITSPDDANDDRDDAGHRVLIFAQLRGSLDLVESLVLRPLGIASVRIDGAVDAGERFRRAQRFNADPTLGAMLLTTGVGGLGLNLTAADTVVFLEHDWNPSRDLQAMDRAHRLGQRRAVNVYRLLLESTIEEEIMGLQAFKTQVARAVIGADGAAGATPGGAGALDAVGAAARRALEDRAPAPAPKPGLAGMLAELQDLDQVDEQYASQFGNSG